MTNKQKFEQIDQSKLNDAQKNGLSQIKDKTNNFTSKDKELNAKISDSLDGIIAKLKQSMPEALKTTSKAPKRTAMGLAKDIRKADESWKDALIRARKQMKEDGESATKIIKSEIEKLKTFIKEHKELEGLHGTDLPRDSVRRAKPKGRRVSKDGNVYYEYRDNRTDRLAPNYPKGSPKLENGGMMDNMSVHDGTSFMNNPVYHRGGSLGFENGGDFMSGAYANDGMMLGNSNGKEEDIDLSDDNKMPIKKMDYQYKRKSAREIAEKHNAAAFEYMNEDEKRFALGGIFSNNFTGETGTHYTGLVGETNAMSSGEMFADGGAIANQQLIADAHLRPAEMFGREGIPAYKRGGMMKYHEGGNLYQHGLDEGDTIVKSFGKYQKVKDENGKIVYVDLATGMRTKKEPLSFKRGGALKGNQSKIDMNKNGKLDAEDFKLLRGYNTGGEHITFARKSKAIAKKFEGKQVEPKYQRTYGKRYDKEEAKEVGNKIAGKMKATYDKKAFGGLFDKAKIISTPKVSLDEKQVMLKNGEWVQVLDHSGDTLMVMDLGKLGTGAVPKRVNISEVDMTSFMSGGKIEKKKTKTTKNKTDDKRGGAMQLAKKIRKEGESWHDALRRATAEIKKSKSNN